MGVGVNIYAEDLTDRIEVLSKDIEGVSYTGLVLYLEPPTVIKSGHYAGQNLPGSCLYRDSGPYTLTVWGKRDLRDLLDKMKDALDHHYGCPQERD